MRFGAVRFTITRMALCRNSIRRTSWSARITTGPPAVPLKARQAVDEGYESGALLGEVRRIRRRGRRRDRRRKQIGSLPVMGRSLRPHVVFEVVGVADTYVPHQVRIRPRWVIRHGLPGTPLEWSVFVGLGDARARSENSQRQTAG